MCVCQFSVFQIVTHFKVACMEKYLHAVDKRRTVCVIYNSIRTSNFGFFCKYFLHFSNTKEPELVCIELDSGTKSVCNRIVFEKVVKKKRRVIKCYQLEQL